MEIIKVNCGGNMPPEIEYTPNGNGAEVWLYKDVKAETDGEGNVNYTAKAVCFTTKLTKAEVLAHKSAYFVNDVPPTQDERLDALEAAIVEITEGVLANG